MRIHSRGVVSLLAAACLVICSMSAGQSHYIPSESVIPLKVVNGTDFDPLMRVFTVPVKVNDVDADFTWGCYGITTISESLAQKCGLTIVESADLDASYKGKAAIEIEFNDHKLKIDAWVMKDSECQESEKMGVIGLDIARGYQWTMDPEEQTLTLRPLSTPPTTTPIAEVPLGEQGFGISIPLTVRNETADVGLMPGSSFVQCAPDLWHKWDMSGQKAQLEENQKLYGDVRIMHLRGKDKLHIGKSIVETDVPMAMVGDIDHPENTPFAQSGVGQCLLNRYVYTVDQEAKKFWILKRITYKPATTIPAKVPDK